jgi:type II secretory pathway pseudopilin PulG
MNISPPGSSQSGFSIVEMMIGVSLVTIAFVGLAPLMISSNHVTESVAENEIARMAARAKLDELRRVPYANLASTYNNQTFTVDLDGDGVSDLRERSIESGGGATRTGTGTSGGTGSGSGGTSTGTTSGSGGTSTGSSGEIPVGRIVVDQVPGGELVGEALRIQVVLRWFSRQGPQEYRLHTIRAKE